MKTTRRHELQTNELADSLAHWIEAVKPYSRAALALVVAVVVVMFAWGYLSAQSQRKAAEGWNAFFDAQSSRDPAEVLADVSARYAGTDAGTWARISLADIQLVDGTNRMFVDKKIARDLLRQATETYRAILLESRQPMILQRATFGLARAHEALGTPDALANAREEYRSIGQKWPGSPYAKDANRRADDLDRSATKNFYDWLARYEPPRPMAAEPGTPGARPDFLKDPLDDSGAELPSAIDGSTALPDLGPAAAPATGDEPPKPDVAPSPESSEAPPSPSADVPAPLDKPATPASDAPPAPAPQQPAEPQPK
jgi:hypothetical protein